MPINTETILLGLPNRWADATFTASDEEAGGPASDLAIPIHSSGWIVDLADGGPESVVVDALEPKYLNAIWIDGARCTGFAPEDLRVKIETASDAAITTDVTDWTGGTVPYRMAGTGGAAARLDMTQPGTGPTDARLAEIMADGRFRFLSRQSTALLRRYARLTFSHVATPAAGQELFIPYPWGGWAWQPDHNPEHGKISPSLVPRPDGSFLFKLAFTLQVVREDELWYRAVQEFLLASGVQNRCWVWWQPDYPERFYQQAFSGQLISGAIEIASEFSEDAYNTQWPIEIVERFNLEEET